MQPHKTALALIISLGGIVNMKSSIDKMDAEQAMRDLLVKQLLQCAMMAAHMDRLILCKTLHEGLKQIDEVAAEKYSLITGIQSDLK